MAQAGTVAIVAAHSNWLDLKREFLELLEQTEATRAATLAHLEMEAPQRAAELRRLLATAASEFLEAPAWQRVAQLAATPIAPPARIGPWLIKEELGRGGMGTVYRAERDDGSFAQTVAVKLIRSELASADLRRRFDSERRILASLDHPNVARLLDAGATADGAPYLVLEYVAGEPIDRYCDAQAMTIEQRLKMLRQVCDAVRVAHQRLILHRDIKTANVLVDARGVPKLLDFGIAKLLAPDLQQTDMTLVGFARPLTPEWSSPEQLRGEPLSTASDVYSLGVLLFVLLTGRRPHLYASTSPEAFAAAIDSARPVALRAAARDNTPPGVLSGRLRGDIERLIHKALAPDLRERYPTVAALDADIERLLAGRPIEAHTRSLAYRFRKLLLRQRVASAAVLLASLGLVSATLFSLRQASIAEQERQRAERRFADVRRIANVMLFELNDKLANISGTLAVRQLLVENALRYLDDMARDSGREPELLEELAAAYERIAEVQGMPSWPSQGRSGNALVSLNHALELHRRAGTVTSRVAEGRVLSNLGSVLAARGESGAALDAQRQAEAVLQNIPAELRTANWWLQLARVQVAAGDATWELGNLAGATRQYQRALDAVRDGQAKYANSSVMERQVGVIEQRLGDAAAVSRDWPEARRHHAASLSADEALLLRDPTSLELQRDLGTDLSRVGAVAFMLGEHREALAAHQRALALRTRLTLNDPTDARAQDDQAESYLHSAQALTALGQVSEARDAATHAAGGWRELVKRDPNNARMRISLANALAVLGRCEVSAGQRTAALSHIAEARRIRVQLAADHPDFSMDPDGLTALDAVAQAIRAGRAPPGDLRILDPWDN